MVVGIFVIAVENTPTSGVAPSAPRSGALWQLSPEGLFTHHSIKKEAAVAKFSSGRMGARPPPPVALPTTPALLAEAAPAGPERHCRKRRGPSAGDGLGNRGTIRAGLLCTDREHGGTQAVSRRSGSPREAWSEGPRVLPSFSYSAMAMRSRTGGWV